MEFPESIANFWQRHPFLRALLMNIGLIIVVTIVILWIALIWLDSWTNHGEYETVPQVKGLSYDVAVGQLESAGFVVELADSVYDVKNRPGTVVDQNPKEGTKVKDGREVYLTITAFEPKQVVVPMLTDVSERQARSVLEALGIKDIRVVKVPSEYKDLVLRVSREGVPLIPGARIPVNSTVTLDVGEGYASVDTVEVEKTSASEEVDYSHYFD